MKNVPLWELLTEFDNFCTVKTGMNVLPRRIYNFNLTMSPLYQIKLEITQKQPTAYCNAFCRTYCSKCSQKVVQCLFLPRLLENSLGCLLTENVLHSHGFLSKIYLQTLYG